MSENQNVTQKIVDQTRRTWETLKGRLSSYLQEAEWPEQLREFVRQKILTPLSEKAEKWHLREKFSRFLPQDIARNMPRTFEPLAIVEWISQAFQHQGPAFYGKILTLVLCTYFLADLTATLVGKYIPDPPPVRESRYSSNSRRSKFIDDYNVIFARNLFNSKHLIPGDEMMASPSGEDLNGPPVRTSLPFNLIGTVILRNELRSIATIEDSSAKIVYPVRVQDEIPNKARILNIDARRVVFVNLSSGRKEYIELPEDLALANPRITVGSSRTTGGPNVEKVSPTQYNVSRQEVDKSLADLNNVLTQARCVPNFENGLPSGYKCFQIVPDSIYDKLGLRNNDVIMSINNQNISDPAKAFEALSNFKEANHIELSIKRDGRPMTLSYDIR